MRCIVSRLMLLLGAAALAAAEATQGPADTSARAAAVSADPNDWPMYNRDLLGTRHNPSEKALGRENVGQLVEKWRFPAIDSSESIGVVHATVVVNGHVYFGTETTPTFNFNWPGKSVIDDKVANSSVASWSFPAVCWLKNLFHQDLNCDDRLTTTAFFYRA